MSVIHNIRSSLQQVRFSSNFGLIFVILFFIGTAREALAGSPPPAAKLSGKISQVTQEYGITKFLFTGSIEIYFNSSFSATLQSTSPKILPTRHRVAQHLEIITASFPVHITETRVPIRFTKMPYVRYGNTYRILKKAEEAGDKVSIGLGNLKLTTQHSSISSIESWQVFGIPVEQLGCINKQDELDSSCR